MAIISAGITDIGKKRKTNQDSICLAKNFNLFLVADGMGGHNGGDIASQMSAKLFPNFIKKNYGKADVSVLLSQAIKHINKSIYDHGQKNKDLKGMGTTISAIMFSDSYLYVANVGDSRVYMINDSKLYQLTRDHSLVQEKLNLGIYDREGAKQDPQKNVLIKTVGFEEQVDVDIYKYKVSRNDMFLICSDGLHGKVADSDIINIINNKIPRPSEVNQELLDDTARHLVNQANINGGQDNISVILVLAQ